MAIYDAIGGYLTIFLVVVPLICLLGFWAYKALQEEKRRTSAIVEREKAATEFYRLAIAEMKDMVYE